MKPMTCERCGGTINPKTMTCEFCGTHYESDYDDMSVIHIATFQPKIHVVKSTFYIDHRAVELMVQKRQLSTLLESCLEQWRNK